VKVLTINDLKTYKYSLQHLLDNNDGANWTDSLGLSVSDSHIIIAVSDIREVKEKFKSSFQVIRKPIAEI
jgi:major membrane immunogen (membrane-anchored lipoprotein)